MRSGVLRWADGLHWQFVVAMIGAAPLVGCGDDGAAPAADESSGSTGSGATDSSITDAPTTTPGPTTTQDPTDPSVTSDPTVDPSNVTSPADSSGTEGTTGEPTLCGITDDPDETGPWFRLFSDDAPLESGGTIALTCGGQGSLMFFVGTQQGGFEPVDETAIYSVTLDVEGFDDVSASGHFYQNLQYGLGVGCYGGDEFDGGFVLDGIAMFPPDGLAQLTDVDGAAGTFHIELLPPDGDPVVVDLDVVIAASQEAIDNCGF